jgi:8-oxo-dGTP diphosphatase
VLKSPIFSAKKSGFSMRADFIAGYLVDPFVQDGPLYLLLKRSSAVYLPQIWQMVTGKIDPSESISQALKREVFEETGFSLEKVYNVDVTQFYDQFKDKIAFSANFCCIVDSNKMVQLSIKEHEAYKWCKFEEAYKLLAFPSQKQTLSFIHEHFVKNHPDNVNFLKAF